MVVAMPSIFFNIRIFSSESALHIRWPKYWIMKTAKGYTGNKLIMKGHGDPKETSHLGPGGWRGLLGKGKTQV